MSPRRRAALSGLLALAAAAACDQAALVGSRWLKQVPVRAADGATLTVSAAESAALAGASLAIGPGALAADAVITLESSGAPLAADLPAAGPAVVWGPATAAFTAPIALAIPYALGAGQSADDLVVLVGGASGAGGHVDHRALTVDAAAGVVRFQATALGGFQAAAVRRCTADADCGAASVCRSGMCDLDDDADGGHRGERP